MAAIDIYDFEGVIENAIAAVFASNDITCATGQTAQKLIKVRPRTEVMYVNGAGKGRLVIPTGSGTTYDYRRESCWGGQVKFELITEANIDLHTSFRTKVRAIAFNLWTQINAQPGDLVPWPYSQNGDPPDGRLRNHKLQYAADAGTSPIWQPDKGLYVTTMLFNTDLSIQDNAWPLLTT